MKSFSKVETLSNWCTVDQLNDKEFLDGEKVEAQWPDGTKTVEKIVYDKDTTIFEDKGEKYEARDYKAYIKVEIKGMKVKVPLRRSDVLLRRV